MPTKWDWGKYVTHDTSQGMNESIKPLMLHLTFSQTIVSLALILKNPAPPFPISGSSISCLPETSDVERTSCLHGWQESLYAQTSNDNKLRGSILSRATLVVCPISLVGQWVEGMPIHL